MSTNKIPSLELSIYEAFIEDIIGKTFKILPIWEDCAAEKEDFESFNSYLDKLITMLIGSNYIQKEEKIYSVLVMLKGLQQREDLTQRKVKSIVFHCIDLLKKVN